MIPQPTPAAEERLADTDITAAIERYFLIKKGVASQLIEVETHEGIVQLSGFTNCLLSRERAEAIAKAVRGVRGVINELVVRTADVPDAELQAAVEYALAQDPVTADFNVRCAVHDGQVLVRGAVQSWAEAQLVLQALKGVRGVRRIANELAVRGGQVTNSDAEITAEIRTLLDWDLRVKSELVTVHAERGVVHLAGTVGTMAERDQVVALAYTAGATSVDAHDLFVASWALDKELRRQKLAPKADADIARAVRDVLGYDPRCRAFSLTVHVRDGVVTLAGTVSHLRARLAAAADAANVVGVREVRNLLLVRADYPAPDAATQEHVKAALACDPFVGHYDFTINVSNGKVQLYGTVDSHADQEWAADVAAGVPGVLDVANHVQCYPNLEPLTAAPTAESATPGRPEPDHVLEQRIRHHYYWSALLHDQPIRIGVHEGRVTLTGTVDTRLDRQCAATEAYACGARDVNNHLRLRSAD
ncbi:BON domain-containing protein [Hymenobacter coalescens]